MLPVLAEASVTLPPLEIGSPPSPMATSHSTDSPHPHLSAPPAARCISHHKVPAPKDGLHLHRKPTPTSHCPFLPPIKLTELTAYLRGGKKLPSGPHPPSTSPPDALSTAPPPHGLSARQRPHVMPLLSWSEDYRDSTSPTHLQQTTHICQSVLPRSQPPSSPSPLIAKARIPPILLIKYLSNSYPLWPS